MSDQQPDAADRPPTRSEMLTMLTTEHYNLQTARMGTISESSGRNSAYLSALSGALVALALVAQVSQFGTAFRIAALIVLPTVLFIGIATFVRQVQLSMADIFYEAATNRIRHFYVEIAPQAAPYFTLSTHDDLFGVLDSMGGHDPKPNPFQLFVTAAGMIAVVNGILAGVVAALAFIEFVSEMGPALAVGALVGLATLAAQVAFQGRNWTKVQRRNPAHFPSPDAPGGPVAALPPMFRRRPSGPEAPPPSSPLEPHR